MKLNILATLAVLSTAVIADTTLPVPASAILSLYYNTVPNLPPAEATSLAKTLLAVELSVEAAPGYSSFTAALFSAAPTSVQAALASNALPLAQITQAAWYTAVPDPAKSSLTSILNALNSAAANVTANAAPKPTGAVAAGVMAAAGVVGALLL